MQQPLKAVAGFHFSYKRTCGCVHPATARRAFQFASAQHLRPHPAGGVRQLLLSNATPRSCGRLKADVPPPVCVTGLLSQFTVEQPHNGNIRPPCLVACGRSPMWPTT